MKRTDLAVLKDMCTYHRKWINFGCSNERVSITHYGEQNNRGCLDGRESIVVNSTTVIVQMNV